MKALALALFVTAALSGTSLAHTDKTAAQVKAMLDAGGDLIVVDVREEYEYCDSTRQPPGHIIGAVNMPWNSGYLQAHYTELDPTRVTIVVCRSGGRSNSAANFLDSVGFAQVFDMLGGMNAWLWETENCSTAGVPRGETAPRSSLILGPAEPNPSASCTEIRLAVPDAQGLARVTLGIYDCRGRLLSTVLDQMMAPGAYRVRWDGADSAGRPVASGIYFFQLTSNDEIRTSRVLIVR